MTAPTHGLGEVNPIPCRARSRAWRRKSSSVSRLGIVRFHHRVTETQRKLELNHPDAFAPRFNFRAGVTSFSVPLWCENYANKESTKSLALKGNRSPAFSPTPT